MLNERVENLHVARRHAQIFRVKDVEYWSQVTEHFGLLLLVQRLLVVSVELRELLVAEGRDEPGVLFYRAAAKDVLAGLRRFVQNPALPTEWTEYLPALRAYVREFRVVFD
jgi:hypothetical protein